MAGPNDKFPKILRTWWTDGEGIRRVHEYMLTGIIASGATSTVYFAIDRHPPEKYCLEYPDRATRPPLHVVIKDIHEDIHAKQPDLWATIISEWLKHEVVRHTNIVPIYLFGVDEEDGSLFLVMPYMHEATTLSNMALSAATIRQREARSMSEPLLPLKLILPILQDVASAISAIHSQNVIHRDLKPDNVLVVPSRDGFHGHLIDLGVAKMIKGGRAELQVQERHSHLPGAINIEQPHMMVGTPHYMSPEQIHNDPDAPVTTSVDIWAFGVLTHEVLTGFLPFAEATKDLTDESTNVLQIITWALTSKIVPLNSRIPGVPSSLNMAINSCLDRNPNNRPTIVDVQSLLASAISRL